MSKFSVQNAPKQRTMYHCIPVASEGEEIRPSANYGTKIPSDVRKKLGMAENEQTPLVFASEFPSKALAFGLRGGEKILNDSIAGTDAELVIICDRDKVMAQERNGTLYAFKDEGFADLEPEKRQSVYTKGIPFSKATPVVEIKNANDLMGAGLQIFSFKETFGELNGYHFIEDTMKERGYKSLGQFLAGMVKEGKVIWENQSRGIDPHPEIHKWLKEDLSPSRPLPKKSNIALR